MNTRRPARKPEPAPEPMLPDDAFDLTKTVQERADAIDEALEAEGESPAALANRLKYGPHPVAPMPDPLVDGAVNPQIRERSESLIPDLNEIYPNAEVLKAELKGLTGVSLETNPAAPIRVKVMHEPEDIYDGNLNPALVNIVLLFLQPVMSEQQIAEVLRIASGRNVSPVSMIRQRLWKLMQDRGGFVSGVPEDRKPAHDDERTLENARLIRLLGWSVYDALQDHSRRFNCGPVTAFQAIIKNAMAAAAL